MQSTPCFALAALLALPLAAQQDAPAPTKPQGPVLVLKTTDMGPLMGLAMAFGGGFAELPPELEEGSHYVLTLDRARETAVTTAQGAVRYLELSADPGALMEVFAEEIEQGRAMAQGIGVMAMTQQGFEAKAAMQMIQGIFDFPKQLERVTVVLATNPEAMAEDGLDLEIGLAGRPGTFAAQLLQALRPGPQGAPVLPGVGGAVMSMAMSLDPKTLPAVMSPFLDFGLSFSYPDPKSRAAATAIWNRMIGTYDGGIAFTIDSEMAMNGVYGFSDAAALGELLGSEQYLELVRSQQPGRDIEVEVTPDAFEHRGTKFGRMHMTNDGPPNPMMPNDEMTSYYGAVGNYLVMSGSEAKAKAIADAVADGKLARKPLPAGAVMTMDVDLPAMLEAMGSAAMPGGLPEDAPKRVSVGVVAKGGAITIAVKAK